MALVGPQDSSLGATLADLAGARPGIKTSELATLLNLNRDLVTVLARRATEADRVAITFDFGGLDRQEK